MGSIPPDSKANVLLVGSGGVGTMGAYALEKGGKASVTAVLRSNFEVVKKGSFQIDSMDHGSVSNWKPTAIRNAIPNVSAEGLPPYDFIVVTTKNIADVRPTVADIIAPAVTPSHTAIVLAQNGLNIEKPLVAAYPENTIISGISLIGATEGPHGTIRHDDHDTLIIGAFENPGVPTEVREAAAKRFVAIYGAASGIDCVYEPDVAFSRWRKLLYNASFNSVATILRMDTSRMRFTEHVIDNLVRPVILEIRATAKAKGVDLPKSLVETMITIDPFDTFFKPSMCQDIEKGNYIEYENIIGEPLREAEKLGVPVPTLKIIYGILKGLQWQRMEAKGLVTVPTRSTPDLKYGDKE